MTIKPTGPFHVSAGETLQFRNEDGFTLYEPAYGSPQPSLLIDGVVDVLRTSAAQYQPGWLYGAYTSYLNNTFIEVGANGQFLVKNTLAGQSATAIMSGSFKMNIVNRGLIEVTADGRATGVSTADTSLVFENHGRIIVTSKGASAWGVGTLNGGDFTNTGLIDVTGHGGDWTYGVHFSSDARSFLNTGTIVARDDDAERQAVGVGLWRGAYDGGWNNQGTIEGEISLWNPAGNHSTGPFDYQYFNSGRMIGDIVLDIGGDRFNNSGTIRGDVFLGLHDDQFLGQLGQLYGTVHGGDGGDTLFGGLLAETLAGDAGADTIDGGGGDDWILGGADADVLRGGEGFDTVSFETATAGVDLRLDAGQALAAGTVDALTGFERAVGSTFADTLSGSAGAETLGGGAGNDSVFGRAGEDSLAGAAGQDYLRGDEGADTLSGGDDFDDINGNVGDDLAHGDAGGDWVVGGRDQDQLFGDAGSDVVLGNLGDDTIDGGADLDVVRGGQGNDLVRGGDGDDWLAGDRGDDTITGGAGADTFHAWSDAGLDRITDFSVVQGDRVNLLPGTTYTTAQLGADVVISMGDARMILQNVQLASLQGDWIFVA